MFAFSEVHFFREFSRAPYSSSIPVFLHLKRRILALMPDRRSRALDQVFPLNPIAQAGRGALQSWTTAPCSIVSYYCASQSRPLGHKTVVDVVGVVVVLVVVVVAVAVAVAV